MKKRKIISILIAAVMTAQGIVPVMGADLEAGAFAEVEMNESTSELLLEENAALNLPEETIMDSLPAEEVIIPSETVEEDLSVGNLGEAVLEEEVSAGEELQEETDSLLYDSEDPEFVETVPDLQMAEPDSVSSIEDIQETTENEDVDLVGASSGKCGENLQWRINDEVLTIYGSGDMWDYEYFEDDGEIAPWRNLSFKSVVVEDGVTSIGRWAFLFAGIESITLGADVKEIGYSAFHECQNLKSVMLNGKLEKIERCAFDSCTALETINIPEGVNYIGAAAFMGCSSIKEINIPKGTTDIKPRAFEGCDSLKSVEIPSTVKAIGYWAFRDCKGLSEIHFLGSAPDFYVDRENDVFDSGCFDGLTANVYYPGDDDTWLSYIDGAELGSDLTWIPVGAVRGECGDDLTWTLTDAGVLTISGTGEMTYAPWDRTAVKQVFINEGATNISGWAFENCTNLSSVKIPNSVALIDNGAFENCTSLADVTIPDGVKDICSFAFYGCSSLTSVTIGKGVNFIDDSAFRFCDSLTNISVSSDNSSYSSKDGVLFNKDQSELLCCPKRKKGSYIVPESVKKIYQFAFFGCEFLTDVQINDNVVYIGLEAFGECTALSEIYFWGDVPTFQEADVYFSDEEKYVLFPNVTARAYFNADNPTWTKDKLQNYGGNITWVPVRDGRELFADVVDSSQFYYDPIYWAADSGITTGYDDNTFKPNKNCNRAAVVTFLWRLAGKPDRGITNAFSDMTGNSDFDHAITWAAEEKITTGYSDGTFRPRATCNRAAIVTFLWRYAGKPESQIKAAKFSDLTGNDDFDKAICWAADKGITTGYKDGTFRPWNQCLRLAIVSFLYRFSDH